MGDFEIDAVLNFMVSRGGRVRNTDLVTHFKNFLNHPNNKARNRERFKDYVNELATIKLDGGEKVLVLKKKYRSGSDAGIGTNPPSRQQQPLTGADSAPKAARLPQPGRQSESSPSTSTENLAAVPAPRKAPTSKSQAPEPPRARSEPPATEEASDSRPSAANGQGGRGGEQAEMSDVGRLAKARSEDGLEKNNRPSQSQAEMGSQQSQSLRAEDATSATGSFLSLSSAASQESVGSSTSGIGSLDDDPNASVLSVMDKVKKLNKIQSETDVSQPKQAGSKKGPKHMGDDDESSHSSAISYVTLTPEEKEWMVVCSTAEYHDMNRLLSKNPALAKLKDLTNGTALHWAAKAGKPDVIKLVANRQGVHIDQRSGYTALHLAAIHGHEPIIELLVQGFKADPNLRDYSGKKAKQYLKNSASSKAQQLLVSRRLGSTELHALRASDDAFIRSTSMRMSNRAKALLQAKSSAVPLLRSSWTGSIEDLDENREKGDFGNTLTVPGQSPGSNRKKNSSRDTDMMPPPSSSMSSMRARRFRYSDRSKSSSRESINSPRSERKAREPERNMPRSESDPILLEGSLV